MHFKRLTKIVLGLSVMVSGFAGVCQAQAAGDIAVKDGEKIAFLGDSITAGGWQSPSGYVHLVVSALASNDIKVAPIPAGVSGHKSDQMLARFNNDVISKKPAWVTISCGVNDVWHGANGIPLDRYKANMTAIVDQAQAAGIKVILLTSTMIREDANTAENVKLKDYNAFLTQLAAEKKCLLADLNADMQKAIAEGEAAGKKRGTMLTADGVHMNIRGDMMMATGILKAVGMNQAELAKAREVWLDIPNGVTLRQGLTARQYEVLEAQAAKEKISVDDLVKRMFDNKVGEFPHQLNNTID